MPPRRAVRPDAALAVRENDLMLARTSDELRSFFRFERAGAPVERRVVYHVPARVLPPSAADASRAAAGTASRGKRGTVTSPLSSSTPSTVATSQDVRFAVVDVLGARAPSVVPDAIALIDNVLDDAARRFPILDDVPLTPDCAVAGGAGARAAFAERPSAPEAFASAQNRGAFAFSRRNTARHFDVVGNVGSAAVAATGATAAAAAAGGGAGAGAVPPPTTSKVVPMCLTLQLRTFTARTARAVHDIALLLALLHDGEGR